MDHKITAHTPDGVWLIGTIDEYPFWAKVCDESSGFGIDNGRVIKLHVGGSSYHEEIIAFERGWDKYPAAEHEDILDALLLFCEDLPAQDIWRNTFRKELRFLVTEDAVLEYEED